jgi:hypothetical protein
MQKEDFDLEVRELLLSFVPVFVLLGEVSEDIKSRAVQIAAKFCMVMPVICGS